MAEPFIGSAALAAGVLTKGQLATRYTRLFRDVYLDKDIEVTAVDRARAAWLWSRRRGVVAGFSAAALHGSDWVDAARPAELIHGNRHRLPGLLIRGDALPDDEIQVIDKVPVTTPARTAVDLACWYRTVEAVAGLDALARAAEFKDVDVQTILEQSDGRRGIVRARNALHLVDAGAESPKESWLRVILIRAGLPRPQTQIPVQDGYGEPFAFLDMGWPEVKVAAEYDGDQHRADPARWRKDAKRHERLQRCGWVVIRVLAGDGEVNVIGRVRSALARRS
jgi:very-short-patch-repair endonuclease